MQARIQRWGDSLAIRIPEDIAVQWRLDQNSVVELLAENGKITLVPVAQPRFSLEQLLEGVTPDNLHQEVDTGEPVGQEVW
ncbi:MAG: AbrB/MazE/SpoVT family DNA-binding domain-containing protein [Armatimonadota bacterium]|nr:AbrB/MazE/SpoVT family DNA-binding domain-containing protein [Armatimonadota bacterium]